LSLPIQNNRQWLRELHLALEGHLVREVVLVVVVLVATALPEAATVVVLAEDQAQLESCPAT